MAPMPWPLTRPAPPLPPSCRFGALPRDVFDTIVRCLTGWDLLQLASVNCHLHSDLLADPTIWSSRVAQVSSSPANSSLKEAKQLYISSSSFHFGGQLGDATKQADRGACIETIRFLPSWNNRHGQLFVPLAPRELSFDVWFNVYSVSTNEDTSMVPGGIILGAQSARWQDSMVWADYHAQFIHVDRELNLYCTVVGDKSSVGKLKTNQWNHLALVFSVNEERVYLNGRLERQVSGSIHRDWRSLYFMQVGTGCTSPGSVGNPSTKFSGWYPFQGVVDDLRMWEAALTPADIAVLATDTHISKQPLGSIKRCEKSTYLGQVKLVRCSRPREGACVVWK